MPTDPISARGGGADVAGGGAVPGISAVHPGEGSVLRAGLQVVRESLARTAFGFAVLVLFVGVGVAGASVALLRAVPIYQSTSTLLFSPVLSSGDELAAFASVNYLSARVNAYVVVGRSASFQNAVRATLPDTRTDRLDFAVSAQSDRLMLTVAATDVDPARASRAADAFARRMVYDVGVLNGSASGPTGIRVDVVAGPTDARRSIAPNAVAFYAIAVLGGGALAMAVIADLRRIQPGRRGRAGGAA